MKASIGNLLENGIPGIHKAIAVFVLAAVTYSQAVFALNVVESTRAGSAAFFSLLVTDGQQGVAHAQVVNAHKVTAVPLFDPPTLVDIDIVYVWWGFRATAEEIAALDDFVTHGGRLILAGDHGNVIVSFPDLAAHFGVQYSAGVAQSNTSIVVDFANPVTNGPAGTVASFSAIAANPGLSSVNPALRAVAEFEGSGGVSLGYLRHGAGEVVFLTDLNTFDDSRIAVLDNQTLWSNLFTLTADSDGDGIEDAIDVELVNGIFVDRSGEFSDAFTDQHLGGFTFGSVVERNADVVTVTDVAASGVLLSGTGGTDGQPQHVRACSNPVVDIFLTDGDQITVTCGSFSGRVSAGPVNIAIGPSIGVTIPAGADVFVEELPGSILSISNRGESGGPDLVVDDNGALVSVAPGDSPYIAALDDDDDDSDSDDDDSDSDSDDDDSDSD